MRRAATEELLPLLWRPVFVHVRARWEQEDAPARARSDAFLAGLADGDGVEVPAGPGLRAWLGRALEAWLRAGRTEPAADSAAPVRADGGTSLRVPALVDATGAPAWAARASVDGLVAASLLEDAAEELLPRLGAGDAALVRAAWLDGATPDPGALAAALGLPPQDLVRVRRRALERLATALRERVIRTLADGADLDRELAWLLDHLPPAPGLSELAGELAALEREPARPAPTGRRLDRFHLGDLVHEGPDHRTYRAHDPRLRRAVLLRVTTTPLAPGARPFRADGERFAALCELEHPGLVRVLGGLETDAALPGLDKGSTGPRRLVQVLEVHDGVDLATRLAAEGPLEPERAVGLLLQATRGLAAAHRSGLLHLGLGPACLVLAPGGCRLTGFGLPDPRAGLAGEGPPPDGGLTRAPEQLTQDAAELSARTDVYGLGMTLAALLCGTTLPDDTDLAGLDPRHLAVIERATALEPYARYRSAVAFAAGLEELLPDETAGRERPRGSLLVGGALAALLLLLLGLWLAGLTGGNGPGLGGERPGGEAAADQEPGVDPKAPWAVVRTSPDDPGLLDALAAQRERLAPHLADFSFTPQDLPALRLALEHGELADRVATLAHRYGAEGLTPPPDLAAVDLLLALDRARAAGTSTATLNLDLDLLADLHPDDTTARLAAGLGALERGDADAARRLVDGVDHPAAERVRAAADLLDGGTPR